MVKLVSFAIGGVQVKQGIHPPYFEAVVVCACGETFITGSTRRNLRVEVCSQCHPLYTGQRRIVDAEGRVQRFLRKYGMDA